VISFQKLFLFIPGNEILLDDFVIVEEILGALF
jgi:hypothetical protein